MEEFENLVHSILSTEKLVREHAENALEMHFSESPAQTARGLLCLMDSPTGNLASLAGVLLRKRIVETDFLQQLDAEVKGTLKTELLALVERPASYEFLRKLADVLMNFAVCDDWVNELMY